MSSHIEIQPENTASNKILSALAPEEYSRIAPNLKQIHLAQGDRLYTAGDDCEGAWFLLDGLLSVVAVTGEGETMDVGMIGREGTAGILAAFEGWRAPFTATVEISGDALGVSAEALRHEFNRHRQLHDILLKYTAFLYQQIAHSALCSRFHSAEQRLCRTLLAISDRVDSPSLRLTHEQLSRLIGAHRPRVTSILDALEAEKVLHLARGSISIADRKGLEAHSCDCYHVIKEAMAHYLAHL
jgi:CRP-like cAMP-binding protein